MVDKKVDLTPLTSKIPYLYGSTEPQQKPPARAQASPKRSKSIAPIASGVLTLALLAIGLICYFRPHLRAGEPQQVGQQSATEQEMDPELSPEDIKLIESLTKAAAAGNSESMAQLGQIYLDNQDYMDARRWYEQAAAAGNARGMYGLGILYRNGQGVPLDESKALEWEEKAAAARNRPSKAP